jgi:23S rRNA pseudouridine955/2504/2580 synthase
MKLKIPKFEELIVFENNDYWVINKPSGVPSLDEHNFTVLSVQKMAQKVLPTASVCHRLDKYTSGCILISKHSAAYREASLAFQNRDVKKEYYAFCEGKVDVRDYLIDLPLVTVGRNVKVSHRQGKSAQTLVTTVKLYKHYSLLSCNPLTGRLHQIRVHLSSLRAPIVGDVTYGGKLPKLSKFKRQFRLSKMKKKKNRYLNAMRYILLQFNYLKIQTIQF